MESLVDVARPKVNYLRLSITDRCNLRCIYCMPPEGISFTPHPEILTYEEILRLVRLATGLGIQKIRVTGGEPLVRRDVMAFLQGLGKIQGLKDISITTNGVMLKEYASRIKASGIHRINISLDSLRPERFSQITGRDYFHLVWDGILEAERVGFDPIKVNVVALRGINDDEVEDFARLTLLKPYHVRFIEYMPVGEENGWNPQTFMPIQEIFSRVERLGVLRRVNRGPLDGPAERFSLEGAMGEIGFIGALSNHFCARCNRLRLTPEGHLRSCLFSDDEIDLKTSLRNGGGDIHLNGLIQEAIQNKPKGLPTMTRGVRKCSRSMSSIGG